MEPSEPKPVLLFLNHSIFLQGALLAAGMLWVFEILTRLPAEVRELRSSRDGTRTMAILAIWLVTALILTWIVRSTALMVGEFLVL